jgi:hypothetical protein
LAHNGWIIRSDKERRVLTLHVAKVRYGPAQEAIDIEYAFDGLRFSEIGVRSPVAR